MGGGVDLGGRKGGEMGGEVVGGEAFVNVVS